MYILSYSMLIFICYVEVFHRSTNMKEEGVPKSFQGLFHYYCVLVSGVHLDLQTRQTFSIRIKFAFLGVHL